MMIELTKKQIESAIEAYIEERMDTETFGKFIQKLIRKYECWDNADTTELLGKFVKKTQKKQKQPNAYRFDVYDFDND